MANTAIKKLEFHEIMNIKPDDVQKAKQDRLIKSLGFRKKENAKKAGYCVKVQQVGFEELEFMYGINSREREALMYHWQMNGLISGVQYPISCINFLTELN